jgi:acyl-coenzyme A synthetase/AMP-(fatty) acid ligase
MARFKAPKSVEFLAELPKSPQGKILKRELRKMVEKPVLQ